MPGTVTVGCKVPNGIIIRAFKLEPRQELLQGGGTRDIKVAVSHGAPIKINGPGRIDRIVRGPESSGYALTHNVDADIWDAWREANKDGELVRNELVIAHMKQTEVSAVARANDTRKTGLEPMDPQGDHRAPRRRQAVRAGAIGALETATRAA